MSAKEKKKITIDKFYNLNFFPGCCAFPILTLGNSTNLRPFWTDIQEISTQDRSRYELVLDKPELKKYLTAQPPGSFDNKDKHFWCVVQTKKPYAEEIEEMCKEFGLELIRDGVSKIYARLGSKPVNLTDEKAWSL